MYVSLQSGARGSKDFYIRKIMRYKNGKVESLYG